MTSKDAYKAEYKKKLNRLSKKKFKKKFNVLSKSQQTEIEREYKKTFPNYLVQPENVNDDKALLELIQKINSTSLTNQQKKSFNQIGKKFKTWEKSTEGKKIIREHKAHLTLLKKMLSQEKIKKMTEADLIAIYITNCGPTVILQTKSGGVKRRSSTQTGWIKLELNY